MRPTAAFQYTFAWTVLVALMAVWLALPIEIYIHNAGPDLPKVSQAVWLPHANRENAILVAVARDGKIFCGNDQVFPESLEGCIRQQLSRGAERKVYIRADARARYGSVETALDGVQAAGIQDVAFIVQERTQAAGARNIPK